MEEGMEKGMEKGMELTARNALAQGIPIDTINAITGLDINVIKNL
jgi:hypothetical protein